MAEKRSIRCSSVRISEDEIAEFERKTKLSWIQKGDIIEITLKHGTTGQHYIGTIMAGLVLVGLGIVLGIMPLVRIVLRNEYPEEVGYTLQGEAYAVPMVLIGLYIIKDLFKQRYYLLVRTHDREHKILFQDKISAAELHGFIRRAQSDFGYNIVTELSPNDRMQPTS
jgi:hypothetical protein